MSEAPTNVLQGWKCPKCGQQQEFKISVTVRGEVNVTDNGFDYGEIRGSSSWKPKDWAACVECNYESTVEDFTNPEAVAIEVGEEAQCGCGFQIVWTGQKWEHDAAPWRWGDDHEGEPSA